MAIHRWINLLVGVACAAALLGAAPSPPPAPGPPVPPGPTPNQILQLQRQQLEQLQLEQQRVLEAQLRLQLQQQQIQIQGIQIVGQGQGRIVVLPGGQIQLLQGFDELEKKPIELPLVTSRFANDVDVNGVGGLEALIGLLKSPDYSAREEGTHKMLRLPPERLDEVVAALARETDSEAIARLTQVAAHLYLKPRTPVTSKVGLRGAWFKQTNLALLGMKFHLELTKLSPDKDPSMTVMVTELQPGFPAYQTLTDGDRIVAMEGVGFPANLPEDDTTYFRSRVAALWPGSVARLVVLHGGKLQEVGVEVTGLPLNGPLTPQDFVDARNTELSKFLAGLKTGENVKPLVMPGGGDAAAAVGRDWEVVPPGQPVPVWIGPIGR